MHKNLFFFVFSAFLAVFPPAAAEDVYDPLEERINLNPSFIPNYRDLMRDIAVSFKEYAKNTNPEFAVVADGGLDLLTRGEWENALEDLHRAEAAGAKTEDERHLLKLFSPEDPLPEGMPNRRYIRSLDAVLITDDVCGKKPLSKETKALLKEYGVSVLAAEHCKTEKDRLAALKKHAQNGVPAHTDTDLKARYDTVNLKEVPFAENRANIMTFADVKNVLIMTDSVGYAGKGDWVDDLADTNYDLLIIDPFYKFSQPLSKSDVTRLKQKKIGAKRKVMAVLNIAVAEDARPYWQPSWKLKNPAWLRFPDTKNPAGTVVDYWNPEWKRIIGIYFKSIMDLGFDGVVLQGLDHHKTYERIVPIL